MASRVILNVFPNQKGFWVGELDVLDVLTYKFVTNPDTGLPFESEEDCIKNGLDVADSFGISSEAVNVYTDVPELLPL